ncbi:MAG: type II secretion system protein [Planctomycetes bacterium]|nr:type II secretion system protein [Planctomycetota bacterium]
MRRTGSQAGVSAMEVLVVGAILVLLAMMAVPGFATREADEPFREVMTRLLQFRAAIDSYWTQHEGFPGPDAASVIAQLTQRTDRQGRPGDGETHALGPYLRRGIPQNPLTGDDSLTVVPAMPHEPDGASAWIYCPDSGEVRCNVAGETPNGLAWFRL